MKGSVETEKLLRERPPQSEMQNAGADSNDKGAVTVVATTASPQATPNVPGSNANVNLTWKEHLLQQFWCEWYLFWGYYWKILVPGILFQYVHNIFHNLVYYLHEQRPELKDLGFMWLGELSEDAKVISEIFFWIVFVSAAIFAISPFIIRYKPQIFTMQMLSRWLLLCSIGQLFRIVSFLSTILPSPATHCRPGSTDYNPPSTVWDVIFRLDVSSGCGDLIFSSHTVFSLTSCLVIQRFSPWWVFKVFAWVMSIAFSFIVISTHKHYSVDVVIAWYTVPLIWIMMDRYLRDLNEEERKVYVDKATNKRTGGKKDEGADVGAHAGAGVGAGAVSIV